MCTKVMQAENSTSGLVKFPITVTYDAAQCGKADTNTAEYGVRFVASQSHGLAHIEMAPILFNNQEQSIALIEHEAVGDVWSRNILSKSAQDGVHYTAQYDWLKFKSSTRTFSPSSITGIHFAFSHSNQVRYCYVPQSSYKMESVLVQLKNNCTGTTPTTPSLLSVAASNNLISGTRTMNNTSVPADEDLPKSWINGKQDGTTSIPPGGYHKTEQSNYTYYIEYNPAKADKSRLYSTRRTDVSEFRAKGLANFVINSAPTSCSAGGAICE